MPSADYLLPNPQYELTRYSTKRLFMWYEQCVLTALICAREAENFPQGSPMQKWFEMKSEEAIQFASAVYEKLVARGIDNNYIGHRISLLQEDINSGN